MGTICLTTNKEAINMERIFDGKTSNLGGAVARFLCRAYSKGPKQSNALWQHYLRPHVRDIDGGTYVPLLSIPKYRGRRPEHVDRLLRDGTLDAVIQETPLTS